MKQSMTISLERLAQLAALYSKQQAPSIAQPDNPNATIYDDIVDATIDESTELQEESHVIPVSSPVNAITDKYGNQITYNSLQQKAVDLGGNGESLVLIGAAGTGKTTSQKGLVQSLILNGKAGLLTAEGHKHLVSGTPGIVVCAYTRRAVANIKRNMPADMQANCITIHKLLEYQPVYYEVWDEAAGEMKNKMVFEATRHAGRPLPTSIHTIIFEESSMLGTDLYKEVRDACLHSVQEVFLGDIQQLPPVFGPAILGFKLLELPVVELTEVYRQALESPIIALAHRILSANPIPVSEFPEWKKPGQLTIHPWKKKINAQNALDTAAMFFVGNCHAEKDPKKQHAGAFKSGLYNPEEDIILLPFNKSFGTIELNKYIANALAKSRKAVVHEVVAGFNKYYFSVGDKVLYDKEDATIIDIDRNISYAGAQPQPASEYLDYWGQVNEEHINRISLEGDEGPDIDFILNQVATSEQSEERVRAASHTITLRMNDSEQELKTDKAADINAMLLGYALTVHKSQGSEWRKVFFVCHQSHATMLQRELLYTAVTRAREELYIICEPETFVNGIQSQRVQGNTLAEKAEYFKGKKEKMKEEGKTV